MALTINTTPARIDRSAAFNVTTSLVEDSTHVNLRVRADVYHEGIIKATVEKPKGLADFDFADILKSLVPGLLAARDSGDIVKTGSIGSQLITSWASHSGTWTSLTSSANEITNAECAVLSEIESNAIAMVPGELYLFYSTDFANVGTNPLVYLESGGAASEPIPVNKGVILMPTTTANIKIIIGGTTNEEFTGTFLLYKITTNRTTVGNLLAPYFVNFTEVYENSSGVTTTGTPSASDLYRYVPAYGDGTAFTEYVLHNNTSLFACKTFKNNVAKIYTSTPYEYFIIFFTEFAELQLYYSKDGGAYDHATHPVCYEGWGAIVLNVGEVLATVASNLRIYIYEASTGDAISEIITLYVDSLSISERVVLEFDGLVGGKEYLAFEGIKDIEFTTIRDYYSSSKKARKPIKFTGINRQKIETRFKDMANAEYLKSLLISENVKKLEASYATPTDVTVLTDNVVIDKGVEFFTNRIDIEYEY